MNWILALLAFAGLMTILSTIVYIIVEALHKGFSLRKAGLSEMLRSLHDHVVVPLDKGESSFVATQKQKKHSKEAVAFAKQIQDSPTYAGVQKWYSPSNWGINLNQRKFERLNRRQLVEQLAQTEFGQSLAKQGRSQIEFALSRVAYEFDRFGEAQSAYFKRRAKVLSGGVAFLFVIVANINVIDMYFYLAKNDQALNATLSALNADNTDEFRILTENIQEKAQEFAEQLNEEGVTSKEAFDTARDLHFYLTELQGGLNLPLGRDYFPYCANPMVDASRCAMDTKMVDGVLTVSEAPTSFKLFGIFEIKNVPPPIARIAHNWQTGLYWIFCMIASAGLLALGAPFWFDLFNKTASYVGTIAAGRTLKVAAETTQVAETTVARDQFDRTDKPNVAEMADAFLIASGVSQSSLPPQEIIGMKIGASSSEETNTLPATETVDAEGRVIPQPYEAPSAQTATSRVITKTIRGVRGNWKGE